MVTGTWRRRGTGTAGCLVWLAIFGAATYYGGNVGKMYWRFYAYQQEMTSQARIAPSISDTTIRRRLFAAAEELNLPEEAYRVRIVRTARPRRIIIEAEYRDSLHLPLLRRGFTFKPRADEPL